MTTTPTQAGEPAVAPEYIRAIAPYQAGKPIDELAREFGLDPAGIVKLASNENPLGMPESARKAVADAIKGLGRYPDPNGFNLKAALSQRFDVPANWITLGNGSNDLLELASLALLGPGSASVYSQYAFTVYRLATQARGARHIIVPAVDYGHDLDAMFKAIDADTRLVFVANPNNPPAPSFRRRRCRHSSSASTRLLAPGLPWCSTKPITNTSTRPIASTASNGCAAFRISSSAARFPRPMGWPACGWATRWPNRVSPTS